MVFIEFCREPSLMQDLYVNYDCDVQCTNLFDAIMSTLCQRAIPQHPIKRTSSSNSNHSIATPSVDRRVSMTDMGVSLLAYQGILAVLHSTAKRCRYGDSSTSSHRKELIIEDRAVVGVDDPKASLEEEVDKWCNVNEESSLIANTPQASPRRKPHNIRSSHSDPLISRSTIINSTSDDRVSASACNSPAQEESLSIEDILSHRMNAAEVLRARRLKKQQLRLIAEKFNEKPLKSDWISYAIELGILPASETGDDQQVNKSTRLVDAKHIAKFLRYTPGLGKVQIGEFISKGPKEQYPFHAEVLREYVDTFNFAGKSFDRALRIFLGEVQKYRIIKHSMISTYTRVLSSARRVAVH